MAGEIVTSSRQGEVQRSIETGGGNILVPGRFDLVDAGEVRIDAPFPVTFIDPPTVTFGAEVSDLGSVLPVVGAFVYEWIATERTDGLSTYVTGMRVYCRSNVPRAAVHWTAIGPALRLAS